MELFQTNIDTFRRASPAKASKRFLSLCLDMLLAVVVASGFFYGAYAVVKSLPAYQEADASVETEIAYYDDLIESTHLVVFEDKAESTRYDSDVLSLKNAARQIVLTYETMKAAGTLGDFDEPVEAETEANGEKASFTSDNVAYFYTQYVPSHNDGNAILDFGGLTPEGFYIRTLKSAFGTNASMFVFDGDAMPYLTLYAAERLNAYLYEGGTDEAGKEFYDNFYEAYSLMLSDGENLVLKSSDYYSSHYLVYLASRDKEAAMVADAMLICLSLSYFVVVFLPQLFLKDGRTFGRLLFGLGVVGEDKKEIHYWQVILRALVSLFGYWTLAFLIPALPPFNFDFACIFLDFISIGSFGLSIALVDFVIAFIALGNGSLILLSHDRISAMDWLTRSEVVDRRHLDEINED